MDWYPHHIGDFDADTLHLSAAERGVYRALIDWYYLNERPLPDDDRALTVIARVSPEEWQPMAPTIRAFFVPEASRVTGSNVLQHKRCNAVIREQTKRRRDWKGRKKKQRKNGINASVTHNKIAGARPGSITRDASGTPASVRAPEERRGEEKVVERLEDKSLKVVSISVTTKPILVTGPEPDTEGCPQAAAMKAGVVPAEGLAKAPVTQVNTQYSNFDPVRDMPECLRRTTAGVP